MKFQRRHSWRSSPGPVDAMLAAREAGIVVTGEAVWKLCELVAAAEREACAKVCEERSLANVRLGTMAHPVAHEMIAARDAEAQCCASAIRARGKA